MLYSVFVSEVVKEDKKNKMGHYRTETMFSEKVPLQLKIGATALLIEKCCFLQTDEKKPHIMQ